MKLQIVIQGPLYEHTQEVIDNFIKAPFVDKIIFSTWEGTDYDNIFVETIKSKDINNPGIGNRNRQIVSTQAGLAKITSDIVAKFRSDQIFPVSTLEAMNNFYLERANGEIFTLGLYKNWPFHPRDHMFWGPTDKVRDLFDCPLDSQIHTDYEKALRAEAWLGCNYAARVNSRIKDMMKEPQQHLTDSAPNLKEAFKIHDELYHKLFMSFPREILKYSWPNKGLLEYYYDYTSESWSEYWYEDIK